MSAVVWFTGLPASGKSTLAARVREELKRLGTECCTLDSDEVRACLSPAPGYDPVGRAAFYDTLSNLAALLAAQGLIVLVPATANKREFRTRARARASAFFEVYLEVPLDVCESRDPKGLYARARAQGSATLPGASEAYESPEAAELVVRHGEEAAAPQRIVELLSQRGLLGSGAV